MPQRKSEIHMHSIFSDGEFSPAQLIDIAQKNDVTLCLLYTPEAADHPQHVVTVVRRLLQP